MMRPAPSESLKQRVLLAVQCNPVPSRATEQARSVCLIAGACLGTAAIFTAAGGIRETGRSPALWLGTVLGSLLIAVVGQVLLLERKRTMLGWPRAWLVVAAVVLPLALLTWKVLYSSQFPHALDPWVTRAGYRCLGLSLALGVLPLGALLYSRRGTDPTHPGTAGMALGVSVGLAVAVLGDLWCPVAYVPHLLLGHLLPIVLFATLGVLLGSKWLQVMRLR